MNHFLPHLASRIFNTPLLIAPSKLDAIIVGLGERLGVAGTSDTAGLFTTPRGEYRRPGYRVVGNVGVVDIFGVLAHRGGIRADSSYVLGYQEVARQLDAALADSQVSSILLNIDSPGGESAGAFDLADAIRAADAIKPVHAIAGDMALSAGYLIASAARQVAVTRTAQVGSIGVVMRHIDASVMLEKEGIKVTHIFAGARKVDGNQFEPLSADARREFEKSVADLYQAFVQQVATNRRISAQTVIDTQAAIFDGRDALRTGLADLVSTPDAMIRALQANKQPNSPTAAHRTQSTHRAAAPIGLQPTRPAGMAIEKWAMARWDADSAIRTNYRGSFARYLAQVRADNRV